MIRYLTAGESHGPGLTVIVEGFPSNLPVSREQIDEQLRRRQQGYGRGRRQQIESDRVEVTSGIRFGKTLGTPITMHITNRDFTHWTEKMAVWDAPPENLKQVTRPRPGHADLAGAIKYDHEDIRDVLERASARNTATVVAAGALARQLLARFGIELTAHVVEIGGVRATCIPSEWDALIQAADASPVRCADAEASDRMVARIDEAKAKGDTVGGVFEIVVRGCPVGLGSYAHPDRRLDGRLAGALMSIQAIKGVEIGLGFEAARRFGSQVHDAIAHDGSRYLRPTNGAGGLEGGVTNGEPIVVRVAMKPISTLYTPLMSVDMKTKQPEPAAVERSDYCAVPAASVVGENVAAWVVAEAFVEKFGGDSVEQMEDHVRAYQARVARR
ncbi:chorismate synthase [Alicyclobacillus macrosporangiidus]|uniref:Chorismate synthase n=1 Tax=Alicyclobacillus macrosporangiidus TaxID=392015 RepID=A0A1I7KTH4_9BACL|nr:chorismate synthase [Alicyclobacillus macrosporangiidus]SFV00735.1 chorismate synthase [Alicyclobacillus macrosporangiidus]